MSNRHVSVRIREITVSGSSFDGGDFRRILRERLRHERAVEHRQQVQRVVEEAARCATKEDDR
jgi:hypothetical protein